MPRNLVICCDGTGNEFGRENTNVVRLVQVLHRDPARQHVYYDPGVGTLPEPGAFSLFWKRVSEATGLAFGAGLSWKVGEAYTFLMDFWEPGDRVFLFGFSRGAYTVRVLAGLLYTLGLLPHGNHNLVPYVLRLFKAIRKKGDAKGADTSSEYWKLCGEFRWTFARRKAEGDDDRHFRVHFLGLWDTVSSVGWVWDPVKFPFTARNPGVDVIRHAVSVDERRWFFRQNLMHEAEKQDLQQRWFPGVHCDVGGGYPEADGGLWRVSFEWILAEARNAGLEINEHRLAGLLKKPLASSCPWLEPKHESLHGLWWLAEFFPKLPWRHNDPAWLPRLGLGKHRSVPIKAAIDRSTLMRIRELPGYSPPNLSGAFLNKVRGLHDVPETLAYEP